MNILAFDTAGDFLSTGLQTTDGFYEENRFSGLLHSEHLLPSIEHLLSLAKIGYKDLDLITCSKGPGSFTGLRIGMSTAKGISAGCGAPVISVNNLDLHASGLDFFDGAVVPVIDARKKRFYSAVYLHGQLSSDYLDIFPEDLVSALSKYKRVLFTGPGAEQLKSSIEHAGTNVSFDSFYFNQKNGISSSLIKAGIRLFKEHGPDPDNEGPFYIRLSDAELSQT